MPVLLVWMLQFEENTIFFWGAVWKEGLQRNTCIDVEIWGQTELVSEGLRLQFLNNKQHVISIKNGQYTKHLNQWMVNMLSFGKSLLLYCRYVYI